MSEARIPRGATSTPRSPLWFVPLPRTVKGGRKGF
mgnify:CR=1|jgi:hypothetical protein